MVECIYWVLVLHLEALVIAHHNLIGSQEKFKKDCRPVPFEMGKIMNISVVAEPGPGFRFLAIKIGMVYCICHDFPIHHIFFAVCGLHPEQELLPCDEMKGLFKGNILGDVSHNHLIFG